LEKDIGFLDHDIDDISYSNGGYDILNKDIMILQDQITPLYVHDKTRKKDEQNLYQGCVVANTPSE
jgi:hypothetical protein